MADPKQPAGAKQTAGARTTLSVPKKAVKPKEPNHPKAVAYLEPEAEDLPQAKPDGKPKSARSIAREFALQDLYQWLVAQSYISDLLEETPRKAAFKQADKKLYALIVKGVSEHEATLAEQLSPYLDRTWAEVTPIEKSVLLIGAYELVHMVDTPFKVAMNESIELAKTFGGTEAHKYVNGVLEKLALNVRGMEVTAAKSNQASKAKNRP
jgi:transcription antitermination protein NusB